MFFSLSPLSVLSLYYTLHTHAHIHNTDLEEQVFDERHQAVGVDVDAPKLLFQLDYTCTTTQRNVMVSERYGDTERQQEIRAWCVRAVMALPSPWR